MPEEVMKNCLVCGGEIHRCKNRSSGKLRRSRLAVTCKHKCSRIYIRIEKYLRRNIGRDLRKKYKIK